MIDDRYRLARLVAEVKRRLPQTGCHRGSIVCPVLAAVRVGTGTAVSASSVSCRGSRAGMKIAAKHPATFLPRARGT